MTKSKQVGVATDSVGIVFAFEAREGKKTVVIASDESWVDGIYAITSVRDERYVFVASASRGDRLYQLRAVEWVHYEPAQSCNEPTTQS